MTEEEKNKSREYLKQYRLKNKEKFKEYYKKNYSKYKEKKLENNKKYYENNKEKMLKLGKAWRESHPEYKKEYERLYRKTPIGRATNLLRIYKQSDKKSNRGICTLSAKWIVENIFSKKCSHCEESDWTKIGCNRINNDLPHTPENVEPCCFKCNAKLRGKDIIKEQSKQVYQYTLNNDLVNTWQSLSEIQRKLSLDKRCISRCCNGITKSSYGFKWSFKPLN